jgi:hypothetical protein
MKKLIIALALALAVVAVAHPLVAQKQEASTMTIASDPGSGGTTP